MVAVRNEETLIRMFHALSDPYRLGMVSRLARGPASVKELAATNGVAMPSAVKHLKVLEDAGLVKSHKAGRVRTFQARPQALRTIDSWLADHKRMLNKAFDRLEQLMAEEPEKG
jgi:DNA-binding transcriptional ArsR family regulator